MKAVASGVIITIFSGIFLFILSVMWADIEKANANSSFRHIQAISDKSFNINIRQTNEKLIGIKEDVQEIKENVLFLVRNEK